jgi:hypothetical protein
MIKMKCTRFVDSVVVYYFPKGVTLFGCMPNTGFIFPIAAEVIIRFIRLCKLKNEKFKEESNDKVVKEEESNNDVKDKKIKLEV